MRLLPLTVVALAATLLAPVAPASASEDPARYALQGGCFALRSAATGKVVQKGGGTYVARGDGAGAGEPFRLQATQLGQYLFYDTGDQHLAAGADGRTAPLTVADASADWVVDVAPGSTFTVVRGDRALAVGDDGALRAVPAATVGDRGRFALDAREGCKRFPEADVNVTGAPSEGPTAYSETAGFVDAHIHMMGFEFLGGRAHCGRPWSRYGATQALVDCPDHAGSGGGAVLENTVSRGNPVGTHDPVGWPTFEDWPAAGSLTHEQTYWKWLERAWRGGLRTYVNLFVENNALCEAYPLKKNSCNEMDSVRLQHKDIYALQDYIDAQYGGPGKGFFRIVTDPLQARRVINRGQLAVVLGIEVSELFDCSELNGISPCSPADVDARLAEVHAMGVRDLELVNKFDNGFGGVAGDSGALGVAINSQNRTKTGSFWRMQTCTGPAGATDREQSTAVPGDGRDEAIGNGLAALAPAGVAPAYPSAPHCNQKGLSPLGEHLVRRMMERGMMIDPDHLDVVSRNQLLALTESRDYSGVISSHTWSTPDSFPRIYGLGGLVTPYAGNSVAFVKAWRETKPMRNPKTWFGFGYGSDMNGFGHQGEPRLGARNPVAYPFKSFDGKQTLDRGVTGRRTWDVNVDGVAHYGLYPDWIEDLRQLAGDEIVEDMARGSEAYLQTWERAIGIGRERCRESRLRFTPAGIGLIRLGVPAEEQLRGAGQPARRIARAWHYCVRADGKARFRAVFDPAGRVRLAASDAPRHRALGVGRGSKASALRGTRPFGTTLRVRGAGRGAIYVWGVRKGVVRFTAIASGPAAKSPRALRQYLRLAGFTP